MVANLTNFRDSMVSFLRMKSVGVLGLMSGTSLDGLDLCYAEFRKHEEIWTVSNLITKEIAYSEMWRNELTEAFFLSKDKLEDLHITYGQFLGKESKLFINENTLQSKVALIASHGHTIFHQPKKGITIQIGAGNEIAKAANIMVVNDFRTKDVSLGGQGAPLVPVGDEFLFGQYESCLNLGGIANISFKKNNQRIAYDICPCNLPLNKLMRQKYNLQFDKDGVIAKSGKLIPVLFDLLNNLSFYTLNYPKSLGVEWLNSHFYPIIESHIDKGYAISDILYTIVQHETHQIAKSITENNIGTVLITGGGAYNSFFIHELQKKVKAKIVIPSSEIISFKEALIFGFLGLLCVRNEINTFKSVTGASKNSIGGVISYP